MSLSLQILIFATLMEAWNPLCYSHSCSQEGIGRLQFLPCLTRSFQRNEDTLNGSEVVWLVTSRCHETSKLMAAKRVSSLQKEFMNVVWNLEEALEDGQQLFVSGSDNALGTWDPRLAIPMSSCNGKVNFWQPEIQGSWGTSFQYNYFVKHSNSATQSIRWRHGPAFCLSLSFSRRFMKKQIVQDRWVGCNEKENVFAHQINSTHIFSKSATHMLVSDLDVKSMKSNNISTKQKASESLNLKDQPIEEPWLPVFPVPSEEGPLLSILTKKNEAKSATDETGTVETILDSEKEKKVKDMQRTALVNGIEDSLGDLEIDDTSGERPTSVSEERLNKKDNKVNIEIIVNSSLCSIQRIAILEDGKPVELFLEPVKANVQLGNIYVGIVKRLLPCMSGAFVDIGDRQLAFLATSKNTKPFTFLPLNVYPKEVQVNDTSSKNSPVSSSLADGGFGNFLDDIADDERSMNYDDALNENEYTEDAFENVCNMEVGSERENDLSSISGMHELVEPDFHENGFVTRIQSQDDGHLKNDDDTEKGKSSTDLGNDKSIPSEWKFLKVGTKIFALRFALRSVFDGTGSAHLSKSEQKMRPAMQRLGSVLRRARNNARFYSSGLTPPERKVAVLGAAGGIGQPLALLMKTNPLVSQLALYDIAGTPGVAADVSHVNSRAQVAGYVGEEQLGAALEKADVVVIPAGVPRKPGMTRDDLFNINAGIVKSLCTAIAKYCPEAVVNMISNPVNSTVPIAAEVFKKLGTYDEKKLFGVTTLDVVRAKTFYAGKAGVPVGEVDVPVVGGHAGITILPLFSQATPKPKTPLSDEDIKALTKRTQDGGTEVVEAKAGKGSATLSMAYAGALFASSVLKALNGEPNIVECTYVQSNVTELPFFASKVRLGKNGIDEILGLGPLSDFEKQGLEALKAELKASIEKGIKFANQN